MPKTNLTTLTQPNNMTFSCKEISAVQYNILVLLIEKLQKHMTFENIPNWDKVSIPMVTINVNEISLPQNKNYVLKEALELMNIKFSFKFMDWAAGRNIDSLGVLVTNIDDITGTSLLRIQLNDRLIPAMTYCGKGVGATRFIKEQTLKDRSVYTKIFRQMLLSVKNRDKDTVMTIEALKSILGVKPGLANKRLRTNILEPVRRAILDENKDVWFEYELFCSCPIEGKKPKADKIRLSVLTNDSPDETRKDKLKKIKLAKDCLNWLVPDRTIEYLDILIEKNKLSLIADKWLYYTKMFQSKRATAEQVKSIFCKIFAEECGIIILESKKNGLRIVPEPK